MTSRKAAKGPDDGMKSDNALMVEQAPEETGGQAVARKMLGPVLKNAIAASAFSEKAFGDQVEKPGLNDYVGQVKSEANKAADGDIAIVSRMLVSQAIALDSMFAELARRTAANMGQHLGATESYARLALKAQGNCRATLETLAKLHQPAKEQIVRHIHVNQGGQAIIAEQFHNHTGGPGNAEYVTQSDATRYSGGSAALRSKDTIGQALPIASREGQETVPYARGH